MLFFKGSQIFASSNGVNLAIDYRVLEKYDKTKKCVAIAFQTINHVKYNIGGWLRWKSNNISKANKKLKEV